MKKIIYLLITLLLVSSVLAISQPIPLSTQELLQPGAPSTDYLGECEPYEIKGEYCSGDIRHYTQCMKTVSGGVWNVKSENCKDYTSDTNCVVGKCVKTIDIMKYIAIGLGIIIAIIIIILLLRKLKKG